MITLGKGQVDQHCPLKQSVVRVTNIILRGLIDFNLYMFHHFRRRIVQLITQSKDCTVTHMPEIRLYYLLQMSLCYIHRE